MKHFSDRICKWKSQILKLDGLMVRDHPAQCTLTVIDVITYNLNLKVFTYNLEMTMYNQVITCSFKMITYLKVITYLTITYK